MNEFFPIQPPSDLLLIDHLLFTELGANYSREEQSKIRHMLKNSLPLLMKEAQEKQESYRLLLPEYFAERLKYYAAMNEELNNIVARYSQHRMIRTFTSSRFFPNGLDPAGDFSLKDEVHFYKKFIEEMRRDGSQKQVILLTSYNHALQAADSLANVGISRIIGFSPSEGFVEYKTVEPKNGDTVYVKGNKLLLGNFIASGGEASIFEFGNNFVYKVYRTSIDETTLLPNTVKFRDLMLKRSARLKAFFAEPKYQIQDEGLIFPLSPITDENGDLIGVVMKRVHGVELFKIINNRAWPFNGFNRIDLIRIAKEIALKVKKIHQYGMLIGDINMRNIFVDAKSADDILVYFIDLDGCQIEGHPNHYETVGYRDPLWNLAGKQPREPKNEVFTLLVLLFEIIHMAHPYTWTGGRGREVTPNWQESMEKCEFPYVQGARTQTKKDMYPPMKARFIYSHLPGEVAELFNSAFTTQQKRPSIDEVITMLDKYIQHITRYVEDENWLEYTNFGIPRKHRVEYNCSHKECLQPYFIHVDQLIKMKSKNNDKHMYCFVCKEKSIEINDLLSKSDNEEERAELRAYWNSQLEERNAEEMLEEFFIRNPKNEFKANWEEAKIQAKLRQERRDKANKLRENRLANRNPTFTRRPQTNASTNSTTSNGSSTTSGVKYIAAQQIQTGFNQAAPSTQSWSMPPSSAQQQKPANPRMLSGLLRSLFGKK